MAKREPSRWQPIETAPRGVPIEGRITRVDRWTGRLRYEKHRTFWGKTSHVPLYGWNWGRDVEDLTLWQPTHWRPVAPEEASPRQVVQPIRDAVNPSLKEV